MAGLTLVGRPESYTIAIAEEICQRLSDGETLTEICKLEHMPCLSLVMLWARDRADFMELYARARRVQFERMVDEIIDISDDATNDWVNRQFGEDTVRVIDHEHVNRSKLRVDSRKWLLGKMLPDRFGDRIAHQTLDEHGKPTKPSIIVIVDGAPGEGV